MKRLYVLLCCVVAWTGYVKGQGGTPPTIDFKEYLAKMDTIMCDSIYRVDTLYYPWEEDMQMIELKWKIVWKRKPCVYDSLDYKHAFSLMPRIFIFRNKEGAFSKVYNNYLNFTIDSQAFKAIDFINTDSYKEKYIPIVRINKYEKDVYLAKGLIDKVGNVKLEPIYKELVFFKADSSIRVKEGWKYYFIDYNSLEKINDNTFQYILSMNREERYSIVRRYNVYKETIIDNRGNSFLKGDLEYLERNYNTFTFMNSAGEYILMDEKFNTIYPPSKEFIIPVFKYIEGKHVLSNLILEERIYKDKESYKNTASLIDMNNNTIIPFGQFNSIVPVYNNITKEKDFVVSKFYKKRSVKLIPLDDLSSKPSKSSKIEVMPFFKHGVYDEHGALKMPIKHGPISSFYNYMLVYGKGKWSIYNLNYEKIIEDVNGIKSQEEILNCRVLYTKDKSYILYDLDKPLVKYKILEGNEKLYYHDLKADGTIVLKNKQSNNYIELK